MKTLLRRVAYFLLGVIVVGLTLWGGGAIWYTEPVQHDGLRLGLAIGFAVLGLVGLIACFLGRIKLLLPFGAAVLIVFGWWSSIDPSNDRKWQSDVAVLPKAEINGDIVTIRNIRNFAYRSETDFTPRWYDKTVDLRKLDSLDLIAVYWMGDAIAHTIMSFGFEGEQIAISIEIRKERGESYSTIAGFFRRFELYYVVGDERDVIGLRTTYRDPPEDVYLYRLNVPKEGIRKLFMGYINQINSLHDRASFYNTLTTNCTTNIVTHIQAFSDRLPFSWKMLASGYFPELIYEKGALSQKLPFDELRSKSLINTRARAAEGAADFSRRIRIGLPAIN